MAHNSKTSAASYGAPMFFWCSSNSSASDWKFFVIKQTEPFVEFTTGIVYDTVDLRAYADQTDHSVNKN